MGNKAPTRGKPAGSNQPDQRLEFFRRGAAAQQAVDRELADLERRKLIALRGNTVKLTRAGYVELARRFPRRP